MFKAKDTSPTTTNRPRLSIPKAQSLSLLKMTVSARPTDTPTPPSIRSCRACTVRSGGLGSVVAKQHPRPAAHHALGNVHLFGEAALHLDPDAASDLVLADLHRRGPRDARRGRRRER